MRTTSVSGSLAQGLRGPRCRGSPLQAQSSPKLVEDRKSSHVAEVQDVVDALERGRTSGRRRPWVS